LGGGQFRSAQSSTFEFALEQTGKITCSRRGRGASETLFDEGKLIGFALNVLRVLDSRPNRRAGRAISHGFLME
jgi:hypothetical protein